MGIIHLLKKHNMYKLCALIGASAAVANGPGITVSVSQEGINNAKNVAVPYIFNIIKDIKVPQVNFDGGFLKNIAIALPQPPISDIELNTDHATNGAELVATGVTAHLTADFSYTYWITVTGSADVKVNKMGIDLEIDISEQAGTPSTELAPKLKVQKSDININSDDLDITLSGSLVAKIASVFIPLFKSTIIPLVVKQVQAQIVTVIDTTVNQDLVVYGSEETIPYLAGVTADYAQYGKGATFTADNIFEMSVAGKFYNKNVATPSTYSPVAFPARTVGGESAQGFLSEYTVNTLLEAAFSTQNTLDITYLLSKLNVTVTTDNLGVVVPEILTKYGSASMDHVIVPEPELVPPSPYHLDLNTHDVPKSISASKIHAMLLETFDTNKCDILFKTNSWTFICKNYSNNELINFNVRLYNTSSNIYKLEFRLRDGDRLSYYELMNSMKVDLNLPTNNVSFGYSHFNNSIATNNNNTNNNTATTSSNTSDSKAAPSEEDIKSVVKMVDSKFIDVKIEGLKLAFTFCSNQIILPTFVSHSGIAAILTATNGKRKKCYGNSKMWCFCFTHVLQHRYQRWLRSLVESTGRRLDFVTSRTHVSCCCNR